MPSWARVKAETVARGNRSADAPARCRGTGFQRLRRAQQKQRKAAIAGGEMQLLAGFQIELVDHTGDSGRRTRTQRLGKSPQRFLAVSGLDQDQAARIETEAVETVSGKPAVLAQSVGGSYEDERVSLRQAGKNRCDEAEGRRYGAFRLGHDFMQRAAGEAAHWQVGIKRADTEGQGFVQTLMAGQEPAQFLYHGGATAGHRKRSEISHLAVSLRPSLAVDKM